MGISIGAETGVNARVKSASKMFTEVGTEVKSKTGSWSRFGKRGLAVLLVLLLAMPVLPSMAEETVSGGDGKGSVDNKNENGVNDLADSASVSGGDATGELSERKVDAEISSVSAGDARGNIASGVNENISWVIDANGKLTVSGTGDFSSPYTEKPWAPYKESIISAEITVSGMTNAYNLFQGCKNLQIADVSGFNTSNVTDMGWMFYGCSSLTSVDLSGFSTSNVTNMRNMFYGCSSLTSVDLSGFSTSNVTDMGWMFYGCSSLVSVDVGGFSTNNVTDMGWMFSGCSSLVNVDVSGFSTDNVTDMGNMFYGCSSLVSVDVSGFSTNNVTDMGWMFSGCSSLKSVDVSGFSTDDVTDMRRMFSGCSSLVNVDVSGFSTGNVTDMGWMFSGCSSLANVDVSGFSTGNVTDMGWMFYDCGSLTNVDVSRFSTNNVTDMRSMFSDCSSLTSVDVSGFDTSNVIYMGSMFSDCGSLTSVDVSGFDTSNVIYMGSMFSDCSSLESVDVSGFDTSNVIDMAWMFDGCSSLRNIDISGFNTKSVTNMNHMFRGCTKLNSIDLSGFDTGKLIDAEYMFLWCTNLSVIYAPCNLSVSIDLPLLSDTVWRTPDGTDVTELPQNLSYSVKVARHYTKGTPEIITTTQDLNMDNVIRVKYVPYSYTIRTNNKYGWNTVTFSIVEGRLAEGLQMYPATGEIYGVPLEAGEFPITVRADYSNPDFPPSYAQLTLIIKDNTDANIGTATDPGYDIIQPVPDLSLNALPGSNSQVLVTKSEYAEFVDLYLDGEKLAEGTDYTLEAGGTRITILNQTLIRKGAGTHTLGIEFLTQGFNELRRAVQNFVVSETSNPGGNDGNENTGGNDTGNNNNGNSGDTGSGGNSNIGSSNENKGGISIADTSSSTSETDEIITVIYTVKPGDNLWKIAVKFYGIGDYWRKIYLDNANLLRNPNRIRTGQKLIIYLTNNKVSAESDEESNIYRVAPGDNLWKIAQRVYGDGRLWRRIYEANRAVINNPGKIRGGLLLKLPQR